MTRRRFDGWTLTASSLRARPREFPGLIAQGRGGWLLARNLQWLVAMLMPLLAMAQPTRCNAQERVLLQEVMPELKDTPLGNVDVAPAPAIGTSLVIRRSDILRALAQAGASAKGLTIPRAVRVNRDVVTLSREQLNTLAQASLLQAVAPCTLRDARFPAEVRVASGPREFHAEFNNLRDGQVSGVVFIDSAGGSARVPVIVTLHCPPPDISAGTQVTAVAVVGRVSARAPAEARQPGRVGEVIRITNRVTGANLRGRVVDARTVEVLP